MAIWLFYGGLFRRKKLTVSRYPDFIAGKCGDVCYLVLDRLETWKEM